MSKRQVKKNTTLLISIENTIWEALKNKIQNSNISAKLKKMIIKAISNESDYQLALDAIEPFLQKGYA